VLRGGRGCRLPEPGRKGQWWGGGGGGGCAGKERCAVLGMKSGWPWFQGGRAGGVGRRRRRGLCLWHMPVWYGAGGHGPWAFWTTWLHSCGGAIEHIFSQLE
jgi:hypothetical protein